MQIDRPIIIAVTLFIILLLVFFLVAPEYNTFKSLQVELGEKTAEYNAQHDYYAAIDKTYFDLQSRKDDLGKIDDALSQGPILGKTIYFLQQTAGENGMIVKDLFVSQSPSNNNGNIAGGNGNETGNNIKDITFSADLSGSYASLENFIISLEKSSHIFEVTSISFGSAAQNLSGSSKSQFQSQQIYSFSLQIKTHSY